MSQPNSMLGIAKAAATTEMFENTCEIEIQFRLHGRIPPVDAIDVWKVPNTQFVLITDTFTT